MLTGNEDKLVRRITSFYRGNRFERDLVSIGGVSTYIERIPECERDRMRAWVLQLDRYVDVFVPPEFTALAGVNDEDGEELYSARAQAAQMREEARKADERREEEELDRLAEEGRSRRAAQQTGAADGEDRPGPRRAEPRSRFSRVDTGAGSAPAQGREEQEPVGTAAYADDAYVRPGERGARYTNRNSEPMGRTDDRPQFRQEDADARLTYESTRRPQSAPPGREAPPQEPPRRQPPKRRPIPRSQEAVAAKLGLDGVLLNAMLADGSFLRYVLERRMIFALWRRGWLGPNSHPYVADASVWQATMAELHNTKLKIDALRTRDAADAARRAQKMEHADVIFDTVQGVISDARAAGMRLDGKLLVCDELRPELVPDLRELGVARVAVFTPMPDGVYVSTAELEAMLSFVEGREPRALHTTDWERLLNAAQLYQEMFPLRDVSARP